MTPSRPAPTLPLALLLTVLLTAWWTALAWTDLAALRLPDADDMMRLAEIRDWLQGQRFSDAVQARLGPLGGTAIPWSRLPDIVPAAIVTLLTPLMGTIRAEVAAVIFWPELLLFAHLLLAGAIAGRLGGPRAAMPAIVLAALAYPAIELFLPGRIDHHGLQIVLVELLVLGLLSDRLFLAGAAAAVSLLIGVETAPVVLAAMAALAWLWVVDRRPVSGFGIAFFVTTLAGFIALRPMPWPAGLCDGFTPDMFAVMLIVGGLWLVLAGLAPRLPDRRWRIGTVLSLGALAMAAGWLAAPSCFASPLSSRQAGGMMHQSAANLIGHLGLSLIGLAVTTLFAVREPERRGLWGLMASIIAASIAGAFLNLSSAWFAAALSGPVLAHMVVRAANRGIAFQIATWLISAGLVWQAVGALAGGAPAQAQTDCTDAATLAALDRLDTGTFAAPLILSAYILGGTEHRAIAGPYHRNAAGNRVMAEFFRSPPEEARYQASLWTIDYIALCPGPHGGLPAGLLRPGGLAAQLLAGDPPSWLDPVPLIGSDTMVWRVRLGAGPELRP